MRLAHLSREGVPVGPTDGRTDGPTDGRTDIPFSRDARTHLKRAISKGERQRKQHEVSSESVFRHHINKNPYVDVTAVFQAHFDSLSQPPSI